MFFDPQNIGLKTCYVQLSLILAELLRKSRFFVNGGTILHVIIVLVTSDHFKNSFIMRLDPQNMGLDTLNVEMSALKAEI